jgi:hypothetical protein
MTTKELTEKLQEPKKEKSPELKAEKPLVCVICGKPAARLIDGDPSCEEHAELVYEDQLENYTQDHLAGDEWLEKKS